jgi:ribosomal protein S18 acetylase RimI-like enzyme
MFDNLIWQALTTNHAALAEGDDRARRYQPEVAGFAAIESETPAAWAALARLAGDDRQPMVLLLPAVNDGPPAGWTSIGGGLGNRMVLGSLNAAPSVRVEIQPLGEEHVPQMLALVQLTAPGPFRVRTIEMGNYYGVFEDGALVAMAGERLQTPGVTEVSAVCTHPEARGRGLASALSHHVASGIIGRGKHPILHVADGNVTAQRVYERLGFVVGCKVEFLVLEPPAVTAR